MSGTTLKSPMAVFQEEAPGVAEAFTHLIDEMSAGVLDAKTRQLMYIGMKASQGDTAAVVAHTSMAKHAGASRDELKEAILMTLTVSGIRGVITCLPQALAAYDSAEAKSSQWGNAQ